MTGSVNKEPYIRVYVAGVGLRGSGYPNANGTLSMLRGVRHVEVVECGGWLPDNIHLWRLAKDPKHRFLLFLLRLFLSNAVTLVRLFLRYRRYGFVYVPYPSIFVLWMISWLPRRWRPCCVSDVYITIWDSIYQDRGFGDASGLFSRLLFRIEASALKAASHLIVDTMANAEHISAFYDIPLERIHSFPLALDSFSRFSHESPHVVNRRIRVLFVGSFVPLQGACVIAEAIYKLREVDNIEFVLVGDGQQANDVAVWLQDNPRVTWFRGWHSPDFIEEQLDRADICLGVFGGNGKASRVLPYKIYIAMAAGKAIITQKSYSVPDRCPPIPAMTCDPSPASLAEAIVALAQDASRRSSLSSLARNYYQCHLSTSALKTRWEWLLASCDRE